MYVSIYTYLIIKCPCIGGKAPTVTRGGQRSGIVHNMTSPCNHLFH